MTTPSTAAHTTTPSSDEPEHLDYDLIVIGGGAAGENVADYATQGGAGTAIVESALVGGQCSYWACMPSKALLRSGHALRAARRVPGAREAIGGELDTAAVLARRDSFAKNWDDSGQVDWVEAAGIELIRGHGRLVGPHRVQVGERILTARAVALATGSVPVIPPIPGLAAATPWTTEDATSAETVPARLIILGGGVSGTELAFAYSSLGAQVTILSRSRLLGREEPFVGDSITTALLEEGVTVRNGDDISTVNRGADGTITVELGDGTKLRAEELLVATGRRPATADIGLETIGQDTLPPVDDTMLVTGTDWLYAVGDTNGRVASTHQGKYQARAAGRAIAARLRADSVDSADWSQHVATADHKALPRVVFSDPEVAAVGLTEDQAHAQGTPVRTVEFDLGQIGGASLHADDYAGRAKLVIDDDRDVVLGATFLGQDVAELLHSATIAIVGEVTIDRLWHAVPSYPTISEIWLRLLETDKKRG